MRWNHLAGVESDDRDEETASSSMAFLHFQSLTLGTLSYSPAPDMPSMSSTLADDRTYTRAPSPSSLAAKEHAEGVSDC